MDDSAQNNLAHYGLIELGHHQIMGSGLSFAHTGPLFETMPTHDQLDTRGHVDSLVQDCSNSSTLAMELPPSCTKPRMFL